MHPPFKHWWLIGALLLGCVVALGWWEGWSGGFVAVAAIAAALYVGLPPMEQSRREMLRSKGIPLPAGGQAEKEKNRLSGGKMAWNPLLTPVVHALSSEINDIEIIRTIAMTAGVEMQFVRTSPDPDGYWTAVLKRAHDEGNQCVDRVLNEAQRRTRSVDVIDSIEAYRRARGGN